MGKTGIRMKKKLAPGLVRKLFSPKADSCSKKWTDRTSYYISY